MMWCRSDRHLTGLDGPIYLDLAVELLSGKVLQSASVQRGLEAGCRLDDGPPSQDGRTRRRGLPGLQLSCGVHRDPDPAEADPELFAHRLAQARVAALPRLRPRAQQR